MSAQSTRSQSDVISEGRSTSDALAIWHAGVEAVDSSRLVQNAVQRLGDTLKIGEVSIDLGTIDRIIVVGAGKAGAGMARGIEAALGPDIVDEKVEGWVNVPGDCVEELQRIKLHGARPPGLNEPTEMGVEGSQQILRLVESLGERDVCLVLISGGGSALLPLPIEGISLSDKQLVTRFLSRSGATIQELNTVRKRLSRIKGGGLLRAAPGGMMFALIISDVIGDPLDIIASGPTVPDSTTAQDAIDVLNRFSVQAGASEGIPASVWKVLQAQVSHVGAVSDVDRAVCRNLIIGRNETAVEAASVQAEQMGYEVRLLGAGRAGVARDIGVELAKSAINLREAGVRRPICFIGGGEPVVKLSTTDRPRKGGRNQEVALSALCQLWREDLSGITILSGGTDGEDGPTDAAGAICSEAVRQRACQLMLDPFDALSINDSYTFFEKASGLIKTGPTHTNVMDLQIAVVIPVHHAETGSS